MSTIVKQHVYLILLCSSLWAQSENEPNAKLIGDWHFGATSAIVTFTEDNFLIFEGAEDSDTSTFERISPDSILVKEHKETFHLLFDEDMLIMTSTENEWLLSKTKLFIDLFAQTDFQSVGYAMDTMLTVASDYYALHGKPIEYKSIFLFMETPEMIDSWEYTITTEEGITTVKARLRPGKSLGKVPEGTYFTVNSNGLKTYSHEYLKFIYLTRYLEEGVRVKQE